MEKVWEDGVQMEARWMQAVLDAKRVGVQSLEVELCMEQLQVEGNDAWMWVEWLQAQRLQESLKMVQVGLESM